MVHPMFRHTHTIPENLKAEVYGYNRQPVEKNAFL
jgi:hypothetical protein